MVNNGGKASFGDVFGHCKNRIHAITTFLALLELVNRQDIRIIVGEVANFFWLEKGPGENATSEEEE
jgi:segregation and condensation protein A